MKILISMIIQRMQDTFHLKILFIRKYIDLMEHYMLIILIIILLGLTSIIQEDTRIFQIMRTYMISFIWFMVMVQIHYGIILDLYRL